MIKEKKVLQKINNKNKKILISRGYEISDDDVEILVKVEDTTNKYKVRITAICEICSSENKIGLKKYYVNYNRNGKGYYSCFKCKNVEKEKTCLSKYGVKSYSMTDKFKITESLRNNGQMRGIEKGRKTMLKKYGVDSYSKTAEMREMNRKWMSSNEFVNKSKKSMLDKYGVDHYSKTDEFKNIITNNKKEIVNKIKATFMKNYGTEWISQTDLWKDKYNIQIKEIRQKSINTCLMKYGVENVTQVKEIYDKILLTKIKNNIIVDIKKLPKWDKYKRVVTKLTNRIKPLLYENWDGYDYYDNEYIKGNFELNHLDKNYPTMDHKISILYGFLNDITEEDISDISNLCITKRSINSTKTFHTEEQFKDKLKLIK